MIASVITGAAPAQAITAPTTTVTTVAGGNGRGAADNQLQYPIGVAVDSDGNVFVADHSNHRAQKAAVDGTVTTAAGGNGAGSADNQIYYPGDVAVDSGGNLYVVDTSNHRVQKVAVDGTVTTVAGGNGQGSADNQLNYAYGIDVDAAGNLYIADQSNHRVQKVAVDGTVTTVAGGNGYGSAENQLSYPLGVEVDAAGNLYVVDTSNHRVQKVAVDGTVTTVAGGNGQGSADNQLSNPWGMAVDSDGNLYVGDHSNHRVQKVAFPDTIDPVVTITTPVDTIVAGADLTALFKCTDAGGSGLGHCDATLNDAAIKAGGTIDTSTPGDLVLKVTAIDGAGNTTVDSVTITVEAAPVVVPKPTVDPRELVGDYKDATGVDGSVARLYMAVFQRQPDAGGHAFWVVRSTTDMTMWEIASYFVTSEEFVKTYADLDNAEFIDLLYLNVMGRAGDAKGVAYWTALLDGGVVNRGGVTLMFVESTEFKVLTKTT